METTKKSRAFDPFLVPDDWARLQYGRLLWKSQRARQRLLRHWTDPRHPYRERFSEQYRDDVIALLESAPEDDATLDRRLRAQGKSLRTLVREIPPVFGSFY
jgi:hypothetical protein